GCAIALVHNAHITTYKDVVSNTYLEQTGLKADFYIAKISGGTARVD
ncbi:MAG TPA: galactokinase, partial [Clostridiales bacterium UBA8960]|nr:galactokinase [Clostridiales bacterium UBA8960]